MIHLVGFLALRDPSPLCQLAGGVPHMAAVAAAARQAQTPPDPEGDVVPDEALHGHQLLLVADSTARSTAWGSRIRFHGSTSAAI